MASKALDYVQLKDFVPFKGAYNYISRNLSTLIEDHITPEIQDKILSTSAILLTYNTLLAIGTVKGIESLMK